MWLDTPITLTIDLISEIMGLRKDGLDPLQYFKGQDNNKQLEARLKERCDLQRDGRAYHIDTINDRALCIGARILASKIVRKNHPIQCTLGVIACTQKCTEGFQMNWLLFLLNQLTEDAVVVQFEEQSFTYSWILILIALVAWMDP